MHLYRVFGGPVSFASGEVVSLDDRQFALREAFVETLAPRPLAEDGKPVPPVKDEAGRVPVRILEPQQFKAGEVVGIDGVLTRYLVDHVVSATEAPELVSGEAGDKPAHAAPVAKKPGGKASAPSKPAASMLPAGDQSASRHARPMDRATVKGPK